VLTEVGGYQAEDKSWIQNKVEAGMGSESTAGTEPAVKAGSTTSADTQPAIVQSGATHQGQR